MWLSAGTTADVTRRRRVVVEHGDTPIVVIAHEGSFYALDNICIHKQRELVKGVVLNGRIVCPGHQWSFELGTGWEAKMERCQPIYDVRVEDGTVLVDTDSRRAPAPVTAEPVTAEPITAEPITAEPITPGPTTTVLEDWKGPIA